MSIGISISFAVASSPRALSRVVSSSSPSAQIYRQEVCIIWTDEEVTGSAPCDSNTATMMHPSRQAYVEEAEAEVRGYTPSVRNLKRPRSSQLNSIDSGPTDRCRCSQERGIALDSIRKCSQENRESASETDCKLSNRP